MRSVHLCFVENLWRGSCRDTRTDPRGLETVGVSTPPRSFNSFRKIRTNEHTGYCIFEAIHNSQTSPVLFVLSHRSSTENVKSNVPFS